MKIPVLAVIAVVVSGSVALAEGPAEKAVDTAAEVAKDTADTAKNVGHSVAKGTKKAVNTVADALTPDADAHQINVTLTEYHMDMPNTAKAGKTAFIVKNEGKQKHDFRVQGNGVDQKFLSNLAPGQTKVLHVDLKHGTYTVSCPIDRHQSKGMDTKLTVR